MTRKDYELIAEVVATAWMGNGQMRWDIANRFADELEGGNPRFDRERFLSACGVK